MAQARPFDRQSLEQALHELGRRAYEEGKTVEIAIYGGSALILTYDWRIATRDVDGVFESERLTVRRMLHLTQNACSGHIHPKTGLGCE